MFLLIFCLLFIGNVLANYVGDVYKALANIPGVRIQLLNAEKRYITPQQNRDIDMEYYDADDRMDDAQTVSKLYEGTFYKKRSVRSASRGGYTSDQDTCKMYNHNLIKIWSKFSKYVLPGNHEVPSKVALHNIAQIVEAYLGHQDSYKNENDKEDTDGQISETEANVDIDEILNKVNKIVIDTIDEETNGKIIDIIVKSVSSATPAKWDETCAKRAKERLGTYVSGTFQKYLENATCRRIGNDINVNNSKMIRYASVSENGALNLKDAKKMLRQWQNDYENCEKTALDKFLHITRLIIQNYINDLKC